MNYPKIIFKGLLTSLAIAIMVSFSGPILNDHGFIISSAHADEPNVPPKEESTFEETVGNLPDAEDTPVDAKTKEDIMQDVAKMAAKSHRLFAPLINFFAFQIGNFLGNDYVYQGTMGKVLHNIWVITRNLVNIAFVFLLLWIAIKTIFMPESGIDELKKNLIKFTMLLVAVNFSWLATKVVLDSASVVTHIVFSIPSGIGTPPAMGDPGTECQVNTNDKEPIKGLCYPTTIIAPADSGSSRPYYWQDKEGEDDDCAKVKKAYYGDEDGGVSVSAYNADETINEFASEENKKFQKRTSFCMESLNLFKYDQNTAVIYLTYGMARIQNLVNATSGGDFLQLSVGVLLSVIIQIAYTVVLGVLLFVLIFRVMMLWLLVAFSPLLVLIVWFDGGIGDIGESFSLEVFVRWAFVPAKVGAIFSVAFIMISAGQSLGDITTTAIDNLATKSGFTYKLLEQKSLFAGMDSLQSFIWLLMTLVVLWMGVFAVVGKLTVIGGWLSSLGETGKNFAVTVASLPYIAPILPLGKGGQSVSAKSMVNNVDIVSKINDYAEANGGGRIRNVVDMAQKASRMNYEKDFKRLVDGNMDNHQANVLAKQLGYNGGLAELMKEDTKTVKEGLKKITGLQPGGEDAIYDAFTKLNVSQDKTIGRGGAIDTAAAPPSPSAPPVGSSTTPPGTAPTNPGATPPPPK